ncbi:MAG: hypothetical protein BMS9Abin25_0718 [Gammaproteobacteria bacterium]|nr:MAG: hypothetical protein BMS9Abin25_0718 [Gammaproteobacteria bacterium]
MKYMSNIKELYFFTAITFIVFPMYSAEVMAESLAKPRVAIMEAEVGEGVSNNLLKQLNLSTVLSEMEAAIQKNRKFELLSRKKDVLQKIRTEQEFSKSNLTKGNAANESEIENANYLIIPTVQDFKFYRSVKPVPNLVNKYIRKDSGMLEINVQVIDTSTSSIKATFYLKSMFATKDKIVNARGGSPSSVYFTKMAKSVSSQMTDQLTSAVFPMRILNIQDLQVWINRGNDGGLKKGDVLHVFRPGVELVDPDTGEVLGSAETNIGKIKVTQINPKFTIANVIANDGEIQKGDIVRKQ